MPTSTVDHTEPSNLNDINEDESGLIIASHNIVEDSSSEMVEIPALPDVLTRTDTNDTIGSEAVLTKIFRTDTENTARNSLLEDFLQLVEPDNQHVNNSNTQRHPQQMSDAETTTIASECHDQTGQPKSDGFPLKSASVIAETDPRLSSIDPDQLKPIASLFTEFYEAQATSDTDMLPQYRQAVEAMDHLAPDSLEALTEVLNDIDRLAVMTGDAFADQRVTLSTDKQEEMAAVDLAKRIIRLSKRMDSQRVELRSTRQSALVELTDAIERSGHQMVDQRVAIDQSLDRRMQLARVTALVEKMDRTRLTDQDWMNPQLQREDDISRITQRLQRTPSAYVRQRYTMSGQKQRDMFIEGIMTRIRRLDELRMSNQDAEMPRVWQHQKRYSMSDYEAIECIITSAPERFENQRALRKDDMPTSRKSTSATMRTATTANGTRPGHRGVQSLDIRRHLSNAAEFFRAK